MNRTLQQHRAELEHRVSRIYAVFDWLPEALHPFVAPLADTAAAAKLQPGGGFRTAVEWMASGQDAASLLRAWGAALTAAEPARKGMQVVLDDFPNWLRGADRPAVLAERLAELAPAAGDLGAAGMARLMEAVKTCESDSQRKIVLDFVAAYAMTTREIVVAAAALAGRAAAAGCVDELARLMDLLPLEKLEQSRDAERLLPALARCCAAGAAFGGYLALCVAVAGHSLASALGLARGLPKATAGMTEPALVAYLDDARAMVEAAGIQTVGSLLGFAAQFYRDDPAAARSFLRAAAEAARRYGSNAGVLFLERGTESARQWLEQCRRMTSQGDPTA